ncbi:threonine synthase [Helicobacter monodelphidis]|uniref:threonine synthase n=1 Tax=Helicobacter sp. 15-1451 TaxID=2004995 RepID=UPI000DCB5937|nr:threonine synthase [Helicobacter sp. 15-1451]RAX57484.1 threonine synthase [Helicobacter sp. 15-1451]
MLKQTRGERLSSPKSLSFEEAILNPTASFGGLYAPQALPLLGTEAILRLSSLSYVQLAKEIFSLLGIEIDEKILNDSLSLYKHFDNPDDPVPLVKINDSLYVQELYHGPTRAFKDIALQPFGLLLSEIAQKRNEHYLILAATSGDTGPATLQSFANRKNISVVCLYPSGGTSDVQRLQMTTANAKNLKVIGIKGNFDDAQTALKNLLNDQNFKEELQKKNILLSAANSVNFGRIAFQIVYHVYSALKFYKRGVDIIVPSGNFGNALGAFYAKVMGFPIGKIIIASNVNNILTEWITSGVYDIKGRNLKRSESPAMDILKSSNVERILFTLYGASRTKQLLEALENNGIYTLTLNELEKLKEYFKACYCNDDEGRRLISYYAKNGYLFDPHTATAFKAYDQFKSISTHVKIVLSTAEWTKFAPTVAAALGKENLSDEESLCFIAETLKTPIHQNIQSLFTKKEEQTDIIEKDDIAQKILQWIHT